MKSQSRSICIHLFGYPFLFVLLMTLSRAVIDNESFGLFLFKSFSLLGFLCYVMTYFPYSLLIDVINEVPLFNLLNVKNRSSKKKARFLKIAIYFCIVFAICVVKSIIVASSVQLSLVSELQRWKPLWYGAGFLLSTGFFPPDLVERYEGYVVCLEFEILVFHFNKVAYGFQLISYTAYVICCVWYSFTPHVPQFIESMSKFFAV